MSITITNNGTWNMHGDIVGNDNPKLNGKLRMEYIMETKVVKMDELPESLCSYVTHIRGTTKTILEAYEIDLEEHEIEQEKYEDFKETAIHLARDWVKKNRSYAKLIEGDREDHFLLVVFYAVVTYPTGEYVPIYAEEDIPDILSRNMQNQILKRLHRRQEHTSGGLKYVFLKEAEYEATKENYQHAVWISDTIVYNHTPYRIVKRWHDTYW